MSHSDALIAQLQAENAQLRSEIQQFTATASHDLRAPLRHIVSYTQLIREDAEAQLSPEVLGFLDTVTQSAQRLGHMLDALLGLSRAGSAPMTLGPVALAPLVQALQASLQAQHPERHIEWRIASPLPSVQADPALLRQVLQHVLDNALKFTQTQSQAEIDIHTQDSSTPGFTTLHIRDNGMGFSTPAPGQLFSPFTRLHHNPALPGHGMGLAIVRKLMERMGGQVHAEAQVQIGCSVFLELPTAAA